MQFEQPDTLTTEPYNPQSLNRYSYALNSPINNSDPTGHCTKASYSKDIISDDECDAQPTSNWGTSVKNVMPTLPINPTVPASQAKSTTENNDSLAQEVKNVTPIITANNPPPPYAQRAATAYFVVPAFIVIDGVLVFITTQLTKAAVLDPEPTTKVILVGMDVIMAGVDLTVAFVHVSYAHWVVTGKFISNWGDLGDWSQAP